ncbi:MAG TPA: hypothetical protein DD490_23700, partial [Acidobacteria bacterium]|nr:hypothetical protein [Acidobacteriota bacterium]
MPQRQDLERPVDEQQRSAAQAVAGEVIDENPDHQGHHHELHQGVGHRFEPALAQVGAGPFHQQALVLAAHRPLRAMGTDGKQAEQGVEIEPGEGARVAARAQVLLHHPRQQQERSADRQHPCKEHQRRAARIEPEDPGEGARQLAHRAHAPLPQIGHLAQAVDVVAAIRHVGGEPALKIAVAEERDLAQEGHAQAGFEMAPEAQRTAQDRQVEPQKEGDDGHQKADRADPLPAEVEQAPEVEEGAEQKVFHQHAEPGHQERRGDGSGRPCASCEEHPQQLPAGPGRRLGER